MAHRTYVPQLIFVFDKAYKYGTRWSPLLSQHLTAPQLACLTSTLAALHDCLILLQSE